MRENVSSLISWCRKWRVAERGLSSVVIFILGMPLILLSFGFGIDIMRAGYVKRVAQSRLDVAVQSAAALTYTNQNGAVRLGIPADGNSATTSVQRAQLLYEENTRDLRGDRSFYFRCPASSVTQGAGGVVRSTLPQYLSADERTRAIWTSDQCRGGAYAVYSGRNATGAGPPQSFDFCQAPVDGKYGIRYEVVERVPTIFMRMVTCGPQFFTFYVSSEELLRQKFF